LGSFGALCHRRDIEKPGSVNDGQDLNFGLTNPMDDAVLLKYHFSDVLESRLRDNPPGTRKVSQSICGDESGVSEYLGCPGNISSDMDADRPEIV
jgi:hypothetical protein